jgi:hypothetical protein
MPMFDKFINVLVPWVHTKFNYISFVIVDRLKIKINNFFGNLSMSCPRCWVFLLIPLIEILKSPRLLSAYSSRMFRKAGGVFSLSWENLTN